MTGNLLPFPWRRFSISSGEAKTAAERILAIPPDGRRNKIHELHLEDPETLLAISRILDERSESAPAVVAEESVFFFDLVEGMDPEKNLFLFDEREYFLGQMSFLAGAARRLLSRRVEASDWFDRAEAWFLLTANAVGYIAGLAYQRLALKIEERKFTEVLSSSPALVETFRRMNAAQLALKCRLLQAIVLKETDSLSEAAASFRLILSEAENLGMERVIASAHVNLVQIYSSLGQADEAMAQARVATPLLRRLQIRPDLAKLQWGIGYLLRSRGNSEGAIEAFRSAQREFSEIGMRADVAAVHLIVADILLDAQQERQAQWEIRAALPIIEEYKLVPEGFAALALLRESLHRRQIDRQALRNLHGYFDEAES